MLGILTNEMYLMYVNMTPADGEFISKSLQEPPSRPIITVIHTVFYICMSSLELLVALERSLATRWADSSVEPRSIFWLLIPYLAVWSAIAWYTATVALIEFNILVLCVTFISVEISSILVNYAIYMYCKRRYVTMFGRSSLTARYQIRETFLLTSAMFPSNLCGFTMKASYQRQQMCENTLFQFTAGLISWVYAFYYEQIPYFVLEAAYQTLHATSCAVSAIVLMRMHPRIKRQCVRIFRKLFPHTKIKDSTVSIGADGEVYFEMLSKSWSKGANTDVHT